MEKINQESGEIEIKTEKKQLKEKAMKLLEDSRLIERLVKTVQDNSNIVGEKMTIETVIVICASTRVKNRATTSTNISLDAASGTGKDYVINGVRKTLFKDQWQKYSNPTATAIVYSQKRSKQKVSEGDKIVEKLLTDSKEINSDTILYVKDASQAWLDHDDNKLLMEDDEINITKTIPGVGAKNIRFKKPTIFITTAETSIRNQIVRRLPNLQLDESECQTKDIIKIQQEEDAFKITGQHNKDIEIADFAMGLLEKVDVSIGKLTKYMDEKRPKSDELGMRTLNKRMQDYIKFYATLHQFQREKDKNGRISVNQADVDNGINLFNFIYVGKDKKIRSLNSRQKYIYDQLMKNKGRRYKIADIHSWKKITVSKTILYRDMDRIQNETDVISEGYPTKYYCPKPNIEINLEIVDEDDLREDS